MLHRSRREVSQHRVRVDDRGQHDDAAGVQPAAVRRHGHAQPVREHNRQSGRRSGRRLVQYSHSYPHHKFAFTVF